MNTIKRLFSQEMLGNMDIRKLEDMLLNKEVTIITRNGFSNTCTITKIFMDSNNPRCKGVETSSNGRFFISDIKEINYVDLVEISIF